MKNILAITLLFALLASSCSSDLNVNAPYKEVQVTYGVLNQQEAVHHIKINKAFLGEADAEAMAKVQDSSEYPEGVLEVILEEKSNPKFPNGRSWSTSEPDSSKRIERVLVTNKEPGLFYAPNQYVYQFKTDTAKGSQLNADANYTLTIKNKNTGLTNTAFTELINDFTIERPSIAAKQMSFSNATLAVTDYTLEWKSPKDARRFNIKMVFNYKEVLNSVTTHKTVEFNFANIKTRGIGGGEPMTYKILGEQFYNTIENAIPPLEAGMSRYIDSLDLYFYVAGEELNTYMEVNEPSTGIVQEKPAYTNFDNGIGIFSSRYVKISSGNTVTDPTARLLKKGAFNEATRFTHYLTTNAGYYPIVN